MKTPTKYLFPSVPCLHRAALIEEQTAVESFLSEWKGEKDLKNISGSFDNNKEKKKRTADLILLSVPGTRKCG